MSGPSLLELHKQEAEQEALANLLASDKPGAGVKALAQGFLAGTLVPAVLQSMPFLANSSARHSRATQAVDRSRLAQYFQDAHGMGADKANEAAVATHELLIQQTELNKSSRGFAQRAVDEFVGMDVDGKAVPSSVLKKNIREGVKKALGTMTAAEKATISQSWGAQNEKELLDMLVKSNVKRVPRRVQLDSPGTVAPIHREDFLENLRARYKTAPKSFGSAYVDDIVGHLKGTVRGAVPIGVLAGIGGYVGHRARAKRLETLRRRASGHQ